MAEGGRSRDIGAARTLAVIAAGTVVGCAAGAAWGWSSGYENTDSAIGTAFLCGLAGALLAVVGVATWTRWQRRR